MINYLQSVGAGKPTESRHRADNPYHLQNFAMFCTWPYEIQNSRCSTLNRQPLTAVSLNRFWCSDLFRLRIDRAGEHFSLFTNSAALYTQRCRIPVKVSEKNLDNFLQSDQPVRYWTFLPCVLCCIHYITLGCKCQ